MFEFGHHSRTTNRLSQLLFSEEAARHIALQHAKNDELNLHALLFRSQTSANDGLTHMLLKCAVAADSTQEHGPPMAVSARLTHTSIKKLNSYGL